MVEIDRIRPSRKDQMRIRPRLKINHKYIYICVEILKPDPTLLSRYLVTSFHINRISNPDI